MSSSTSSSEPAGAVTASRPRAALRVVGTIVVLVAAAGLTAFVMRRANVALKPWNFDTATIVFVGTSHTANGIVPVASGPPVGVVSFPGLDHQLANAVMAQHEDRWPRLSVAVLEVDEFTLFTDMTRTDREAPLELLARLDLAIGDLPPAADRGLAWRSRMWLAGKGTSVLDPSLRFTARRLFFTAPPVREQRALTAAAGVARVAYLRGIAVGRIADNIDALVRLSRRLTGRGVHIVLMSYPQHYYYRAARPPEWNVIIDQATRTVMGAVPDVERWDYRTDSAFVDGDFANVDHLSAAGAEKLSTRVVQLLSERRP